MNKTAATVTGVVAVLVLAACGIYHPAQLEHDHETPTPGPCAGYVAPDLATVASLDLVDIQCGEQVIPTPDPAYHGEWPTPSTTPPTDPPVPDTLPPDAGTVWTGPTR